MEGEGAGEAGAVSKGTICRGKTGKARGRDEEEQESEARARPCHRGVTWLCTWERSLGRLYSRGRRAWLPQSNLLSPLRC